MQPQAMRDPVNCAAVFLIVLLRAGLMLSLMSIGRELRKALDVGLGLGRCLNLFCELRFQTHLSTSHLHVH